MGFEFDTLEYGIASLVFRTEPGFIGSGRTAGGAREFVILNLALENLANLINRIVE